MNRKTTRGRRTHFALCIDCGEYTASLQARKLYEVMPDTDAARHGQVRVIDDSGEDYLYPREYFQPLELTPFLNRLVRARGGSAGRPPRPVRRAAKVRAGR